MAKNLFDGLSPQAAFAVKLLSAAGLDLAALQTAGDVNALKVALESAKTNPDLAAAITEATNKLQGDLTTANSELETAKSSLKVVQTNLSDANAAFLAAGVDLSKVTFKAGDVAANTLAVKDAMKLTIATAARTELARHGIAQPLPEPAPVEPNKAAKKPGEGLTGMDKVRAVIAASKLISERAATRV